MSNYVKQFNEASCSVASTATVLNSALEYTAGELNTNKITQYDILEKVRAIHWKERMQKGGYKGKRGVPIDEYETAIESSLRRFDVPFDQLDVGIVSLYQV